MALGVTLLIGLPGAIFWSFAIAAALIAYMITIGRLMRARRMPIDFTARHAVAGIVWLVLAIVCGLMLAISVRKASEGNRIASAYGAMGLLGWISNFLIGMSYQLFPGFVARARVAAGWRAVTIAELSIKSPRWLVLSTFNTGVALMAAGFMVSSVVLAQVGASGIAIGGIVYSATTLWTLSFAYRDAVPKAALNPMRVLPS